MRKGTRMQRLGKLGISSLHPRRFGSLIATEGWTLVESWVHAGDIAQKDFLNLGNYNELLVHMDGVLTSIATRLMLRVSSDNGANFLSASGDYKFIVTTGVETNDTRIDTNTASQTAARSSIVHIQNFNLASPKLAWLDVQPVWAYIIPVASALNAIRLTTISAANLTGGAAHVFGR